MCIRDSDLSYDGFKKVNISITTPGIELVNCDPSFQGSLVDNRYYEITCRAKTTINSDQFEKRITVDVDYSYVIESSTQITVSPLI